MQPSDQDPHFEVLGVYKCGWQIEVSGWRCDYAVDLQAGGYGES